MSSIRNLLGIGAGLALGVGIVIVGETLNHALWPPPAGLDPSDPAALRDFLAQAPIASLAMLPAIWIASAFAGAFVAAALARSAAAGWIAGGILFAATITNLILIRHPTWVFVVAALGVPLAIFLGARLGVPKPATAAEAK